MISGSISLITAGYNGQCENNREILSNIDKTTTFKINMDNETKSQSINNCTVKLNENVGVHDALIKNNENDEQCNIAQQNSSTAGDDVVLNQNLEELNVETDSTTIIDSGGRNENPSHPSKKFPNHLNHNEIVNSNVNIKPTDLHNYHINNDSNCVQIPSSHHEGLHEGIDGSVSQSIKMHNENYCDVVETGSEGVVVSSSSSEVTLKDSRFSETEDFNFASTNEQIGNSDFNSVNETGNSEEKQKNIFTDLELGKNNPARLSIEQASSSVRQEYTEEFSKPTCSDEQSINIESSAENMFSDIALTTGDDEIIKDPDIENKMDAVKQLNENLNTSSCTDNVMKESGDIEHTVARKREQNLGDVEHLEASKCNLHQSDNIESTEASKNNIPTFEDIDLTETSKSDEQIPDETEHTEFTNVQMRGSVSTGIRPSVVSLTGDLSIFQDDEIVLSVLTQSDEEEEGKGEDILKVELRSSTIDGINPLSGIAAAGISNYPGVEIPTEVLSLDSSGFEEISLQSSGVVDRSLTESYGENNETCETSGELSEADRQGSGITRFFKRNPFARRTSAAIPEEKPSSNEPQPSEPEPAIGWKLFGKVPPKQTPQKHPTEIQNDYKARQSRQKVSEDAVKLRSDREVPSTTALILQPRPSDLPAKDPEEELRHQLLYNEMVDCARRKEQKEAKLRKKKRELQIKHEEELSAALKIWNQEILPNWETTRHSKRAQDLWWNGVPPSVRGKVWKLAIGNDLNITADLYEICLMRAKEKLKILKEPPTSSSDSDSASSNTELSGNRESSVELISLDVSRTFPQLCIFQKKGPYHELLQGLLGAYVCYRPDVGYVQGMSFLAAVLLLNMEVTDTFICFANLLNKPCNVAFFSLDETNMKAYFSTYQMLFKENLPRLYKHFTNLHVTPDLYIIEWMYTMFAKSLPLDVTSRVWDVFFRDGEEFLFRTALGILRMYRDVLLRLDFIHLAQFLTKLPENIQADELFKNIANIHMTVDKVRYDLVFIKNKERCAAAAAMSSSPTASAQFNANQNNSRQTNPSYRSDGSTSMNQGNAEDKNPGYVEFPLLTPAASAAAANNTSNVSTSNSETVNITRTEVSNTSNSAEIVVSQGNCVAGSKQVTVESTVATVASAAKSLSAADSEKITPSKPVSM